MHHFVHFNFSALVYFFVYAVFDLINPVHTQPAIRIFRLLKRVPLLGGVTISCSNRIFAMLLLCCSSIQDAMGPYFRSIPLLARYNHSHYLAVFLSRLSAFVARGINSTNRFSLRSVFAVGQLAPKFLIYKVIFPQSAPPFVNPVLVIPLYTMCLRFRFWSYHCYFCVWYCLRV